MEKLVKMIVRRHGGYREKNIMARPHTIEKDETWNNEHQVLNILEKNPGPDGYRNGFAVDLKTMSICG